MKKLLAAIATLALILSLTACKAEEQNWTKPGDTIYKSESVSVTQIEKRTTQYANYQYAPLTEEKAFNKDLIILTGTVSNIRYMEVEYREFGSPRTDHITLFDVKITQILQGKNTLKKNNSIVTMGIDYNFNNFSEGHTVVEDGKSYLIFCAPPKTDGTDYRERAKYVDYWIRYSQYLLIEQIGEYYLADGFFANYVPSTETIENEFKISTADAYEFGKMSIAQIRNSSAMKAMKNTSKEKANVIEDVMSVIKERTRYGSAGVALAVSQNCLINCEALESAILNVVKNGGE